MADGFVIAIDFGTAFSGYAFNVAGRKAKNEPYLKRWGKEIGLDTLKTPTCILFDENKEFMNFGYKAKTVYTKMRGKDSTRHYLFEDFKTILYEKELSSKMTIKATNGKPMEALKIFSESLRFLKDDALQTISSYTSGSKLLASDFNWVLTVPAIWTPSAKQFMRKAAAQAGITTEETDDRLVIALEPEAASLWCKKLPADGFISQNHSRDQLDQTPGTQYMVVDCGGGTIDITVHKILKRGFLKELHKVSGNNLGGQTVDRSFKEFLRKIFGDVWKEFEENYLSGVQRIMYEFTLLKQVDKEIQMSCPSNLVKLAEKKQEIEKYFESVDGASWDEGYIRISREILSSFFAKSLKGITDQLKEIMNERKIDYIVLVGGYAQSQILRQHVQDHFGDRCTVLCPCRPQEAILMGAIEFGRNPQMMSSRKSPFTYGFAVCEEFDESKHDERKTFTADGRKWCRNLFRKLLEVGEDVNFEDTKEFICCATSADQKNMVLAFYRSSEKDPVYVDENEVEMAGTFNVDVSDSTAEGKCKIRLEIMFGSTEIVATATNMKTGQEQPVRLDFMTKDRECTDDTFVYGDGSTEDDDAA